MAAAAAAATATPATATATAARIAAAPAAVLTPRALCKLPVCSMCRIPIRIQILNGKYAAARMK